MCVVVTLFLTTTAMDSEWRGKFYIKIYIFRRTFHGKYNRHGWSYLFHFSIELLWQMISFQSYYWTECGCDTILLKSFDQTSRLPSLLFQMKFLMCGAYWTLKLDFSFIFILTLHPWLAAAGGLMLVHRILAIKWDLSNI